MSNVRCARLAAVALAGSSLLGCRLVWVHPEATEQKFQEDTAHCKYGITATELVETMKSRAAPVPPLHRDWRNCMQLLGWATEVKPRGHRLWDTP